VIVAIISSVIGQQKFTEQRAKQKFRPSNEWFANMQQAMEQSPNDYEQNDQPQPESQFTDFYVEDYEPQADAELVGGNKFVRHPSQAPAVFQSLCPTTNLTVLLDTESHEYRPSSYIEKRCEELLIFMR
jgi:hypothetical protein